MYDDKTIKAIDEFISLLTKHNIFLPLLWSPVPNTLLPDEVKKGFQKLLSDTKIEKDEIWHYLGNHYSVDAKRLSKRTLYAIDVETKCNIIKDKRITIEYETRHGLVTVPDRSIFIADGFSYKNYFLIPPSIIRENYHLMLWIAKNWKNQWNLQFLIDHDYFGLKDTKRDKITIKARWFGPPSLMNLKEHGEATCFSDDCFPEDKTEFYFIERKIEQEKKLIEWEIGIEELLPLTASGNYEPHKTINGEEYLFCARYAHCILNEDRNRCRHLDFSIRYYGSEEKFKDRITKTIKEFRKGQGYKKLVRFDSKNNNDPIPFGNLICIYFYLNPNVLEFFGGKGDYKSIEKQRRVFLRQSIKNKSELARLFPSQQPL